MRMKACLIAVICMSLWMGEVSHAQEGAPRVWVLEGTGQVFSLPTEPTSEITIDLPGGVTMELVRIPAGSFMMGSNVDSNWSWCSECEKPVHEVSIGSDFYMGKTEITQAQWLAVMGIWPGSAPSSRYGLGDDYPAYHISWDDIAGENGFIERLNALGRGTFRLPSEAQWEYAARAGSATRFSFGNSDCPPTGCSSSCELDQYAWWCGNNDPFGAKPVGGKLPNAFGLFDMHGNVWEWCQDYWHGNYNGAPVDGSVWESPTGSRVARGGRWRDPAGACRSSVRYRFVPDGTGYGVGFRVVREAD